MTPKVRRGLGLLALVPVLLLVDYVAFSASDATNNPGGAPGIVTALLVVIAAAAALAGLAALVGGLVLIAWGLLRDPA